MWIVVFTFLAFFLAAVLVLFTVSRSNSKESKQTVSRLESISAPQSAVAKEDVLAVRRVEQLSGVPWLDDLLRKLDISDRLRLTLYQAGLPWTVARLLVLSAVAAAVCGMMVELRTRAVPLALAFALGSGSVPYLYVLHKRAKRFDRMRQHLPEALDLMAAAIRAGHSLASAINMAAKECPEPIRREFRQCFDEQNYGLQPRLALLNLAHRVPIHDIRILVTAVLIQNETGGNLTEILDKVGYLIREDFRLQRQVRVHTAQGRMTGWILSLLPVILGVLLYLVNPDKMRLLWERPVGMKMLCTSIVMTATGGLIIRRIIRIQV